MVFADLVKRWGPHTIDQFAGTYNGQISCLTPDFLVQVLKQLMLSPVIGEKKLTDGVHQSTLLPECYSMLKNQGQWNINCTLLAFSLILVSIIPRW